MILVDAHVHIYECFNLYTFLHSALVNFRAEAARSGRENDFSGILLLAEATGKNWFRHLLNHARGKNCLQRGKVAEWEFHITGENCSLWAENSSGRGLYLIAGRQIVTRENLEVLALATQNHFRDGSILNDTILEIRDCGAIPVIPWGLGKWIGRRGVILKESMTTLESSWFFLGDNGGRPFFWPRPSQFKEAEANGPRVLQGTDPLPFPWEASRPGSFGFTVKKSIDVQKPASDLKEILMDPEISVQPFGKLARPYPFFKNQFRMQVRKILGRS